MKHLQQTDESRIKDRLMVEIGKTKDLPTLIGLVGAWAKIRAMELKQEDGDWGEGLAIPEPSRTLPPIEKGHAS
jgi:hypothetical protein